MVFDFYSIQFLREKARDLLCGTVCVCMCVCLWREKKTI